MKYWRIYTDKKARNDVRTCDIWYEKGMAFAGDKVVEFRHAKVMRMVSVGDGIFMHHKKIGIVGYGTVTKRWDRKSYEGKDKELYVDGKADEIYEYRIKVKWLPGFDTRGRDKLSGIPVSKYFRSDEYRDNVYNGISEDIAL